MEKTSIDTESEKPAKWNQWFRLAQGGNKEAAHNITVAAQQIIDSISNEPWFCNRLGKDEACSIAYYTLAKFIKSHHKLPDDAEVPYLLCCVIRRGLKDSVRNLDIKDQYEQLASPVKPKDSPMEEDYMDNDANELVSTDNSTEPETCFLNNELCDIVREAVQQLPETERAVIHALYYQDKGMKEIARDLNCSFQFAYKTRRNAYTHLHKMLNEIVNA